MNKPKVTDTLFKESGVQETQITNLNQMSRNIKSVLDELFDLSNSNTGKLDRIEQELDFETQNPQSSVFDLSLCRNNETANSIGSKRLSRIYINELEDYLNNMYKNLYISTQANNEKITSLQEKIKMLETYAKCRDIDLMGKFI